MKKLGKILLIALVLSVLFAVGAFASSEPSGEPSAEPAATASAEPDAGTETTSFDVTILVNGEEYRTAQIGIAADGNVYTFEIAGLLDAFGVQLDYNEETNVATLSPVPGGLMAAAVAQLTADAASADEPSAKPTAPTDEASAEPAADTASGEPSAEPAAASAPMTQPVFSGPAAAPAARNWMERKPRSSFH